MALIPCPECGREVSTHAKVCPGCGFPVLEALRETLDEVTGSDRTRPFRGKAAAQNLAQWADRYEHPQSPEPPTRKAAMAERGVKLAIWGVVLLVVVLQLFWVFGAMR